MAIAVDDDPAHALSRRWRRRALHSMFAAIARMGEYGVQRRAARTNVEVLRDIAYGPHPVAHRLDIYRPRFAPRPLPVLVYIHGGGFTLCSKETHQGIALINAYRSGYLVFNINYRLAPNYRFPAAIEDACAAYRWVVDNAQSYGGDPSRIVVAGESAGGNLALGVAVASAYERPEPYAKAVFDAKVAPVAVMPIMPYLQVTDPVRHADNPANSHWPAGSYWVKKLTEDIALFYLGNGDMSASDKTLMADPIRVMEECGAPQRTFPEVFSGAGTADICCQDLHRLEHACQQHRVPITVHYYSGEIHAFHALRWWRPTARDFWRASIAFMQRVGAA